MTNNYFRRATINREIRKLITAVNSTSLTGNALRGLRSDIRALKNLALKDNEIGAARLLMHNIAGYVDALLMTGAITCAEYSAICNTDLSLSLYYV